MTPATTKPDQKPERSSTMAPFLSGLAKSVAVSASARVPTPTANFGNPRASASWQAAELRKHFEAVGRFIRASMVAERATAASTTRKAIAENVAAVRAARVIAGQIAEQAAAASTIKNVIAEQAAAATAIRKVIAENAAAVSATKAITGQITEQAAAARSMKESDHGATVGREKRGKGCT